jgi:hypothetical protein
MTIPEGPANQKKRIQEYKARAQAILDELIPKIQGNANGSSGSGAEEANK